MRPRFQKSFRSDQFQLAETLATPLRWIKSAQHARHRQHPARDSSRTRLARVSIYWLFRGKVKLDKMSY
jgi:hypothetical protein